MDLLIWKGKFHLVLPLDKELLATTAVGIRKISQPQELSPLLVIKCRVFILETMYSPQTKMD